MANTIDFILTNAASELILKVLGGKTLNFTRMAVGDGFSYDTTAAKGYKTLVNEVLSIDITKKETLSASSVKVTSAFKNTDAQKEFYYREVGLYAQDPDTGDEILYAYGNRNDASELITPSGSSVITKQLAFIISVGNSANVTFNVNASVYALQEDLTSLQTSLHELNSTKADKDSLVNGLNPRDGVKTYAELQALTTKAVGDYYWCSDGDGVYPEGNYRWTGTSWSFCGTGDEGYSEIKNEVNKKAKQSDLDLLARYNVTDEYTSITFDSTMAGTLMKYDGTAQTNSYTTNYTLNAKKNLEIGKYRVKGYTQGNASLYVVKDSEGNVVSYENESTLGTAGTHTVDITISEIGCTIYVSGFTTTTASIFEYTKRAIVKGECITDALLLNSPIYGKKVTLNGDSICYGAGFAGGFAGIIAEKYNMTVDNQAVSGATIADLSSRYPDKHSIVLTVDDMGLDADYVIFEGGYNDWYLWTKIGTITSTMNDDLDTTTFYGALESICRQALIKWSDKKIGWIITHKINDAWRTQQSEGSSIYLTLDGYYQAIREVCEKYSIPYLDLSKSSHLITELDIYKTTYTYNSDGIHPNELGYNIFYVPAIEKWLLSL